MQLTSRAEASLVKDRGIWSNRHTLGNDREKGGGAAGFPACAMLADSAGHRRVLAILGRMEHGVL